MPLHLIAIRPILVSGDEMQLQLAVPNVRYRSRSITGTSGQSDAVIIVLVPCLVRGLRLLMPIVLSLCRPFLTLNLGHHYHFNL